MTGAAKHTPGPWEIGADTRGYEVCTIHGVEPQPTEDGLGQTWVYVFPPRIIDGEWHWPEGAEQLANARLIAAAPDMRTFLDNDQWSILDRAIERYTDGEISDLHALGLISAGFLKLDADRKAAIAKAEGGKL